MKVAYLGPKGTFSEEAAARYFGGMPMEPVMYDSILDVIEAVHEGRTEKGIIPIENAIEGTITMATDGMIDYEVEVEGEAILPVSMHLLTVKGAKMGNIKELWSIPPALAQCRKFTKEIGAKTVQFSSTSNAAETLRQERRGDAGAIASEWAANLFGLEIAKRDIHDLEGNSTRFLIIAKKAEKVENPEKSLLLITPTEDRPGLLAVILNVFSSLGINLTWIESRPTKRKLGTYRFFLEAHERSDGDNMRKAIKILETYGHEVRLLGSFNAKQL